PGGAAGRPPRLSEAAAWLFVRSCEDVQDEACEPAFAVARDRPPSFEQRPEVGREREHAPLAGLGGARLESDLTGVEGDVRPAETGGFGPPAPARRVEERHEVGQVGDSRRRTDSKSSASKKPRRTLSSRRRAMCGREARVPAAI